MEPGKPGTAAGVGPTVRIDVWSDVVCPWCYLGMRRLDSALERLDAEGTLAREVVVLRWRAFELDPGAPSEPQELRPVLERRYGPGAFDAMAERLTSLGRAEGIEYRFERTRRVNTFDAHRLVAWSATQPAGQDPLVRALFRAHFTDGEDLSDRATLTAVATRAGLDAAGAAEVLSSDAHAGEVHDDEAVARSRQLTGVPAAVVDGRLVIPGAQDVDTIVRVLRRAVARAG